MKITTSQLQRLIQEELQALLHEVATARFKNLEFDPAPHAGTKDFKPRGRFQGIGADLTGQKSEFSQEKRDERVIKTLVRFLSDSRVNGVGFKLVDPPRREGESIVFSMNNPEMFSGTPFKLVRPEANEAAELGKQVIRTLKLVVKVTPDNTEPADAREEWDAVYADEYGEYPNEKDPEYKENAEMIARIVGTPRPEEGAETNRDVRSKIEFKVDNTLPIKPEDPSKVIGIRGIQRGTAIFYLKEINDLLKEKTISSINTQINNAYRNWEKQKLWRNSLSYNAGDIIFTYVDGKPASFPYNQYNHLPPNILKPSANRTR